MEQRTLGRTGLVVSALGFGCGAIGGLMVRGEAAEQRRAAARALEAGIRYFDTAPSYGDGRSEENLGRVLSELGRTGAEPVVGTKFRIGPEDLGDVPGAIRRSIEASLHRLRRERVHLLQLHNRIVSGAASGGTAGATGAGVAAGGALTAEQVLGPVADGLQAVREAGLAEHAGVTGTGDTEAVRRVLESGRFETAQIFFNALNPSAGWPGRVDPSGHDLGGIIDTAAARGLGVIVIRPLAAGAAAARAERHPNAGAPGGIVGEAYADDVARAQALAALAADLGLEGPVELALRFALAKAGVATVLVGFSDAGQLSEAIRWAERGSLPADAVARVLSLRGRETTTKPQMNTDEHR